MEKIDCEDKKKKKMLLFVMMAMALLFCGAPALADFILPNGTTDIADEAFYNASVPYYLTIPDGVKTIGISPLWGPAPGR